MTWILFNLIVVFFLMLDLGVFHKSNKVITVKESLVWSAIWIVVALIFNAVLFFWRGSGPALEFFTVYLIERSLSVDNIFVFILVFAYFNIKAEYQYRVLFWGIIGALIMRALFIVVGVALIAKFHWIIYIFGALLVYIGIKLWFSDNKEIHPEQNIVLRVFRKFFHVSADHEGGHFLVRKDGKRVATVLFLVLLVIETTDVVFALDSIPAALAISRDSFIIYSANVFAILGLRALYFALAGCMQMFKYLQYGLSVILTFVGAKMLIADLYHIPIGLSLGFIAFVLVVAVVVSVKRGVKEPPLAA